MSHVVVDAAFTQCLKKGCKAVELPLTPAQEDALNLHARELFLWNKKINLTAIRSPKEVAEKHFVDAVAVSRFIPSGIRLMDLGSGGGFPGLPIKVMVPDIDLTLVDASRKKINFLKQVIRVQGLDQARAVHSRVEDLHEDSDYAEGFDGVISRGFANLEKFVELAQPLLKPQGVLYALKGDNGPAEITPALEDQFKIETEFYSLPFEKADRYLIRLLPK